jgi:hypothetical protein
MPSKLSRWLVICSSCVVLPVWFESAVAAQGQRGRWPLVHVSDPLAHRATTGALEAAAARLSEADCKEILTDFNDANGRSLASQLSSLAVDIENYLRMITFVDGTRDQRCDSGAVLFTAPGSRVVRVCSDQLKRIAPLKPEYVIASFIHEILHTLGLGENPPSSSQITASVLSRCARAPKRTSGPTTRPDEPLAAAPSPPRGMNSRCTGQSWVELGMSLENQAETPVDVVTRALEHMTRMFENVQVRVVWRQDPRQPPRPVIALIVPDARAAALRIRDIAALGATLRGDRGGGPVYVFWGRVERAAAEHHVEPSVVLGSALAHEAAHAILEKGAHARSGVMRASWDEQQFHLMRSGLLLFSAREGEAIRTALQDCAKG